MWTKVHTILQYAKRINDKIVHNRQIFIMSVSQAKGRNIRGTTKPKKSVVTADGRLVRRSGKVILIKVLGHQKDHLMQPKKTNEFVNKQSEIKM